MTVKTFFLPNSRSLQKSPFHSSPEALWRMHKKTTEEGNHQKEFHRSPYKNKFDYVSRKGDRFLPPSLAPKLDISALNFCRDPTKMPRKYLLWHERENKLKH
jgi:hypothetical protein